jgi:hypothetical protein
VMDPDVTLQDIRDAMESASRYMDNDTDAPQFCVVPNRVVHKLLDNFAALDGWLTSGGFVPMEWGGDRNR